jgi:hypothetical protein
MQQRESLRLQGAADEQAEPGDVAARPVEAREGDGTVVGARLNPLNVGAFLYLDTTINIGQ